MYPKPESSTMQCKITRMSQDYGVRECIDVQLGQMISNGLIATELCGIVQQS